MARPNALYSISFLLLLSLQSGCASFEYYGERKEILPTDTKRTEKRNRFLFGLASNESSYPDSGEGVVPIAKEVTQTAPQTFVSMITLGFYVPITVSYYTDRSQFFAQRKAEREKEEADQAERVRKQREALEAKAYLMAKVMRAGASKSKVIEAWGIPDRIELKDGTDFIWYQNGYRPIYFGFKIDRLISFFYDKEGERILAEQRRSEESAHQQEKHHEESQMELQKMRTREVRCVSKQTFGGRIQTDCY